MNSSLGSWTLGNLNMEAALKFARYDSRLEMGTGGHDTYHGGAIFPDTLRWIWRDYPGVKGADDAPDLDAVIGQWDVVTNMWGRASHSVLTITAKGGALVAKLRDDKGVKSEVTTVNFEDGVLSYEFVTPPPQFNKGKEAKSKEAKDTMTVWVKVTEDTFEGALSSEAKSDFILDYSVKGQKKGTAPDVD